MRVIVNGEQREIAAASVDALLAELDYEGARRAVRPTADVDLKKKKKKEEKERRSGVRNKGERRLL